MITNIDDFRRRNESNGPKGKDLTLFVRFGGLDLRDQKGYTNKSDATYHSPPAPRGFYAMPKVAQEFFLIGSLDKTQLNIFPKAPEYPGRDASPEQLAEWEKARDEFDWDAHGRRRDKRYSEIRKEFRKEHGSVWHHLGERVPNSEVEARKGSWVKTSMAAWRKAFSKESINNRYGRPEFSVDTVNRARMFGYMSQDHYEVFFDEKV